MSRWGLDDSHIQMVTKTLARFPEIQEARIFGSRAMGNYKPGSDVDIALFGKGSLSCTAQVSAILNEELPLAYRFDVVDYAKVENKEFTAHIDQFGQQLFSVRGDNRRRDPTAN